MGNIKKINIHREGKMIITVAILIVIVVVSIIGIGIVRDNAWHKGFEYGIEQEEALINLKIRQDAYILDGKRVRKTVDEKENIVPELRLLRKHEHEYNKCSAELAGYTCPCTKGKYYCECGLASPQENT